MWKKFLSLLLAVCVLAPLAPAGAFAEGPAGPQITVVADGDSRYAFQDSIVLGSSDSTRYDGRVWTDKTVSTEDYVVFGPAAGEDGLTIEIDDDADFLMSYSAFATSTSIVSQESVPVDLVLVLDMSPQINSAEGKTQAMLNAVSDAVRQIMQINPKNRVGVIAYSSQAQTLLPLDQYETVDFTFNDSGRGQWGQTEGGLVTCAYTTAAGSAGNSTFTIAANYKSGVDKYTQQGIYAGMKLLYDEQQTDTEGILRQPTMILLSEGEPKIASTNIIEPTPSSIPTEGDSSYSNDVIHDDGVEIWRNFGLPDSQSSDDEDNNLRHAQTFATLLTAAYWKEQVSRHYSSGSETREMQIYTIGVRMDSANSPDLAKIVLNPKDHLEEGASAFSGTFIGYAAKYLNSEAVSIPDAGANGHTSTFEPNNALGLNGIDDLKYNNGFYEVTGDNSNLDWSTVLEEVIAHVTDTAPKAPTHVTGDLDSDGYITYVDPIGEYMEVKAVKALIFNHLVYYLENPRGQQQDDGSTVYTFSAGAKVPSPTGGMVSLEDVHIQVAPDPANKNAETLTVEIPAALIPLRTNTITLDVDGKPISNVTNNAYPLRLFYTVGLQEGIVDRQTGKVITEAVSDEYLATHSNADGTVNFYANRYSGMGANDTGAAIVDNPDAGAQTVGDAYTTFTPARDNPFYFVQEDTPLYLDKDLRDPAMDEFDPNATYYFEINYYDGAGEDVKEVSAVVSRPASSFMANDDGSDETKDVIANENGQLVIRAGRPRLGYLTDFIRYKEGHGHYYDPDGPGGVNTNPGNHTSTASTFYYPTYVGDSEGTGAFKMYLGNNGRVTAGAPDPAVGTLSIGKFVVGEETDTEFTFTIQLTDGNNNPLDGAFNYTGVAADPDEEAPGSGALVVSSGSGIITLKDGQGVTIQGLPKGTRWRVTENLGGSADYLVTAYPVSAGGAAAAGNTASGTIAHHGAADVVAFSNFYQAPTGTLVVKKEVTGEIPTGEEGAQYTFQITLQKPGGEKTTESFSLVADETKSFEDLPLGTTYTVTELVETSSNEEELPGGGESPEPPGSDGAENTEGSSGEEQSDPDGTTAPGSGGQPNSGESAGNHHPEDTDDNKDDGDSQSSGSAGEANAAAPAGEGQQDGPSGEPLLTARTLSAVGSPSSSGDPDPATDAAPGNGNGLESGEGDVPEGGQIPGDGDINGNNGAAPPTNGSIPAAEPEHAEPAAQTPAFTPLVQTQSGTISQEETLLLTFVNTYANAASGAGTLTIAKIVDGENPDPDAEFVFHLEYTDGNGTNKQHIYLTAGADSIPVTIPAGASYTVYEEEYGNYTPVVREMSGVMADAAQVRLEFHNVPGNTSGEPAVYLPLPAVRKYVSGNNVPSQEFTFTLNGAKQDEENAYVPMPAHGEASVAAGHGESASFGYITYHPANVGTYIYTIREDTPNGEDGETSSWIYDDAIYTYIVKVDYDAATGTLTVTPSMQKDGENVDRGEFTFNNAYLDPGENPDPEPGPAPEPDPDPPQPGHGGADDDHDDTADHPISKDPQTNKNPSTGGSLQGAAPHTAFLVQAFPIPSALPKPKADVRKTAQESSGAIPATWFAGAMAAIAAAGGGAWLWKRKKGRS